MIICYSEGPVLSARGTGGGRPGEQHLKLHNCVPVCQAHQQIGFQSSDQCLPASKKLSLPLWNKRGKSVAFGRLALMWRRTEEALKTGVALVGGTVGFCSGIMNTWSVLDIYFPLLQLMASCLRGIDMSDACNLLTNQRTRISLSTLKVTLLNGTTTKCLIRFHKSPSWIYDSLSSRAWLWLFLSTENPGQVSISLFSRSPPFCMSFLTPTCSVGLGPKKHGTCLEPSFVDAWNCGVLIFHSYQCL